MPTQKPLKSIISCLLTLLVGGCTDVSIARPDAPQEPPTRSPEYDFGFYNLSGKIIRGVDLDCTLNGLPYHNGAGVLSPDLTGRGTGAISAFGPDPIPKSVTLKWQTADGKKHQREIEVASKIKDLKTFSGVIYFEFTGQGDNDVKVVAFTHAQIDKLAHQQNSPFGDQARKVLGLPPRLPVREPEYDWGFYNATTKPLNEVAIDCVINGIAYHDGDPDPLPPDLKHEGDSTIRTWGPDPMPARVTVSWRTADGKKHKQDVEVASTIQDLGHFTGIVYFKFTPEGGVKVVPIPQALFDSMQQHGRVPIP